MEYMEKRQPIYTMNYCQQWIVTNGSTIQKGAVCRDSCKLTPLSNLHRLPYGEAEASINVRTRMRECNRTSIRETHGPTVGESLEVSEQHRTRGGVTEETLEVQLK